MIARAMLATLAMAASAATAMADWKPTKSVEFIVTSASGGGTDQFARTIQSVIAKYKLMDQPPVVLNKGGGSGAEGFVYGKGAAGDPHKVIFATNNEWLLPLVAKLAFKPHPHMLRHACGYALANKGHDTRALQAYLGHRNIQHTVRYTELSPARFKDFWR